MSSSSIRGKNGQKRAESKWGCSGLGFHIFRERESTFSLELRSIGSSVFDEARRKAVLHGEDYAWAPIWCISDNSKR